MCYDVFFDPRDECWHWGRFLDKPELEDIFDLDEDEVIDDYSTDGFKTSNEWCVELKKYLAERNLSCRIRIHPQSTE